MSAVQNDSRVANPFANAPVVSAPSGAGAAALVQREVAEVQAAMTIAKKFPRDPIASMDRILNACARPSLADDATYTYARGGQEVSGASIRLAEVMAREWGNIQCGVMEITRHNGVSECLAYAWDLETNFKDEKRFQVKHWRDTKKGGYAVTDERDIYEMVANMGARRKRACILAVIPGDVQETAVHQCDVTLRTKVDITPERVKAMVDGFATYGVTAEMIEKKIQRRLEALLPAQMVQLRKIYTSLKDGMGSAGDYFDIEPSDNSAQPDDEQTAAKGNQGVKEKLKRQQSSKPDAKKAAAAAANPTEESRIEDEAIPQFDKDAAIQYLQQAADIELLNKAWAAVALDYDQTDRQVEDEVVQTYKQLKAELSKI